MATITFRAAGANATGTTSVSVAQPAGTVTGDVLIAFIVDHANSGSQSAAPTGWTPAGITPASANGRFQCFIAVVGQNSLGASPWSFTGLTTRSQGVILGYFSGANAGQPDVVASVASNASGTTGTASITSHENNAMVIAAFSAFASGSTWTAMAVATGPVLTSRFNSANSTFCSIGAADGNLAPPAATGVSSATMGTAGVNGAILISLAPVNEVFEIENTYDKVGLGPPSSLGTLQLYAETEQFDWGWKPPTIPTYQEDGVYQCRWQLQSIAPEIETEQFDWGYNVPLMGVGSQMMGYSGYWVQKPAMGMPTEQEQMYPNAPFLTPYGEVQEFGPAQQISIIPEIEAEIEQVYPNAPFLTPFWTDDSPEQLPSVCLIRDDAEQQYFVEEFVQDDDQRQPQSAMIIVQEDEPLVPLPGVAALPNMLYDFDYNVAQQVNCSFSDLDTEEFDWGYAVPLAGVGSQAMGYSGFWVQKPAMGDSAENNQVYPAAPFLTPYPSDDAPEQFAVAWSMLEQVEDEQIYPNAPFLTPIGFDDAPESLPGMYLVRDDVEQQNFVEVFVQDDQIQPSAIVAICLEDEPLVPLPGAPPLPNMLYDADFNPTMQLSQAFGLEDPEWGFNHPTLATYQEDAVYQDRPVMQSMVPEIETEQFDWGYNVPLAGVGSQMQGYSGFWVSKPAMGTEVDAWGYNPVVAPAAITPFADDLNPVQFILQYQDVEDSAFNPVIVGTGGTQLMGFRGFGYYKAAMEQAENEQMYPAPPFLTPIGFDDSPEQVPISYVVRDDVDQFSFNPPVVVTITPFDFDQQPLQANPIVDGVEDIYINTPFSAPVIFDPGDEFQPLAQPSAQPNEDEQIYPAPPFLTPIGFDDAPEQVATAWRMQDDVDTFGYLVSQTFAEPQEYGPAQQRSFVPEIEDESAQVYPNPPFITAMPFDDSPEQLPNITVVMDIDNNVFVFGTFVAALPNMLYDADFNPTMQRGFYFTSPEDEMFNWGYKPPTIATYQEDGVYQDRMMQSVTPEIETEQFDWGFDASRYYGLGDEAPYFTSLWQMQPKVDDDTNWGFKPPAPVAISGFDQDELPPTPPQRLTDDVMDSSYNPVIVGTGGTQLMGFRGQWAPKAGMGSEFEAWSFNPPVPPVADAWEMAGLPPTPPFMYQDDVDVTGFQHPVAYPGIGQDDDQVPQFPVWSLDWAEGWEALPGITIRPITVPIVYKVANQPLLSLLVAPAALLLRVEKIACSNKISVQGIAVQ